MLGLPSLALPESKLLAKQYFLASFGATYRL
jgi:hypothetical protein